MVDRSRTILMIKLAKIITRQEKLRDLASGSEWRPFPSWGVHHALSIVMCGSEELSMAYLSSLIVSRGFVACSLDTRRILDDNDLTTLPAGLFDGLEALALL